MISRRLLRNLALLVIAMFVLSACGGSDPEGTTDGAPGGADSQTTTTSDGGSGGAVGDEGELEQAATDMFLAYLSKDDQTYFNLLSQGCRERLQFAVVDNHLTGRRFRAEGAGIDLSTLGVSSVDITAFGGDSASVILVLSGTTELFEESIPNAWVYEEGGWHKDECSNITEAQGGLEGYGTDRNDPVPYGGVAEINGWLFTVSFIQPDAEDLVVELGGEPAAGGNQLFNIQLNPSYDGPEASTVLGEDLALAMMNGSTTYGDEADCGSEDSSFIDMSVQAGPGEGIGLVFLCWEVPAGDADGMLLRVTDLSSGTDYWFDLTQP